MNDTPSLVSRACGRRAIQIAALVCALAAPALAQPRTRPAPMKPASAKPANKPAPARTTKPREQNFNFEGLGIQGTNRSPQLLYFLERASEELERASLEKRSFIPRMVRTVEEEAL